MLITSLVSFFGGSAFRMIWGEVSSWLTARQDHSHEVERMRLQAELDQAQHARQQDAIRLQAELGVKTIHVQAEADVERLAAQAFNVAVEGTTKTIGVWWADAWNAVIRPGGATLSLVLVAADAAAWLTLKENHWALVGAFLGIYVADRALFKRGK